MTTVSNKILHVEFAKFVQNNLLENNIDCFLVGGSLINAVRDKGNLISDDIDFAIVNEENIEKILQPIYINAPPFTWTINSCCICLHLSGDVKQKVDLFVYSKKYLN